MQATPSTWRLLLESGWQPANGFQVWCGGEPLPNDLAADLLGRDLTVWNLYGPTETTVWSTAAHITDAERITIGRPIQNTEVYVLDEQHRWMPTGVPGELYIGGAGVTKGYLNRSELTAERFIAHPFKPGERLYRTGDLVRLGNDGFLEHLGRLDHQVKVRGFRVELGQIEAALLRHPSVADTVVHAKEIAAGDQRLIAYLVAEADSKISNTELRAHLRKILPDYMMPQFFVPLDALPRTPNGKVDRNALPEPSGLAPTDRYEPAQSDLEQTIANLWAELIGIERVGRNDNFFSIGGHSLLAVKAIARISQEINYEVPLRDMLGLSLKEIADRAAADAQSRPQGIAQRFAKLFRRAS